MANIELVVFDLGGTLMEYKGMHLSWVSYYKDSFDFVNKTLALGLNENQIEKSIEILKNYNPRVKPREEEIAPEKIFSDLTSDWNTDVPLKKIIDTFFEALHLEPLIYDDSIPVLAELKKRGFKTAVLTDVATGMPDELHKNYVSALLPYFDLYVSSLSCGYKKPNVKGLKDISDFFNVKAENMIMIGDDLRDVTVAKNFGCKSVLIERKESDLHVGEKEASSKTATLSRDYGQDFTINKMHELLDILI